jgi:hypothetical protein
MLPEHRGRVIGQFGRRLSRSVVQSDQRRPRVVTRARRTAFFAPPPSASRRRLGERPRSDCVSRASRASGRCCARFRCSRRSLRVAGTRGPRDEVLAASTSSDRTCCRQSQQRGRRNEPRARRISSLEELSLSQKTSSPFSEIVFSSLNDLFPLPNAFFHPESTLFPLSRTLSSAKIV